MNRDDLLYVGDLLMSSRTFDEMDRMVDQMDRIFEQMRTRFADSDWGTNVADVAWNRGIAFDRYEHDDALVIVADVPGFERDEIELTVRDSMLHLDASHEEESEQIQRSRSVSERISIPTDVDVDDISASYHNGVLEVTLPYVEDRDTGRHIDIE